jgi:suppressor of ftsI
MKDEFMYVDSRPVPEMGGGVWIKELDPSYCPEDNCIKFEGHGFGSGYHQYDELKINKSIDDVINKCLLKCANDEICTGFGFRINARYDGRSNGNCWFMKDEFMYVDSKPVPDMGGGVWIKELDPNSDYQDNTLIWVASEEGNGSDFSNFSAVLEFCHDNVEGTEQTDFYGYRLEGREGCTGAAPLIRLKPGNIYRLTLRNTADPSIQTNLHTHGLHISGDGNGDDVTRFVEGGKCLDYYWHIPETYTGGTHWYHPHKHHTTAPQVVGGAFGMLIVDDDTNLDKVPAYLADEKLLQISKVNGIVKGNSQRNVVIHMTGNKWYRLRISMVDPLGMEAEISFGAECEVRKVANDGVWLSTLPAEPDNNMLLTGASRADVAIKCQAESTIVHTTLSSGAKLDVATIKVKGFDLNTPDPTSWSPRRPDSLMLDGHAVAGEFNLTMNFTDLNNHAYNEEEPLLSIPWNTVQEWTLKKTGRHPLHLHLYHMQVVTSGGCGNHEEGQFYDTISSMDDCKVRFKTADFGERLIFHCHILTHEDLGMMNWANVTGEGMPINHGDPLQHECAI